ncbi:flavodoxin [Bacillus sp. DNRA2]|uniref:flavodoxin n=1 Tax=Bacillus sp. DNRA2 TaxID=2723053 RepID=UPI00145E9D2B|nr:flavodoxin [Bacillus sp. DNRA2]NMD68683.1 flavodoxin [Bacillus sp. DNRA2]
MDIIIIYTSMTGTTEQMANIIAEELMKVDKRVVLKDSIEVQAEELISYDMILIGSYTWGDGELPDELVDFYDELRHTDLTGKIFAIFGAGDSSYTHFAKAVDILEETVKGQGGRILVDGLKTDRESEDNLNESCRLYCKKLTQALELVWAH